MAKLHTATLTTSFLAGLGYSFLSDLYGFLITNENVWVYEENKEVMGFVSYSENSAGMMKRFLIHCPVCIVKLALGTIAKPTKIKRFVETFRAPFQSKDAKDKMILPSGELLSISVNPNCQASGIGSQLIAALEDYLKQNKITNYKVVAGDELIGANKFYLKNGFVLAKQIKIHGEKLSNVYIKNIK
ncbi:MAG TPA: GNAT family N-acetyltransferase [Prolixibacteraceae bacterium]